AGSPNRLAAARCTTPSIPCSWRRRCTRFWIQSGTRRTGETPTPSAEPTPGRANEKSSWRRPAASPARRRPSRPACGARTSLSPHAGCGSGALPQRVDAAQRGASVAVVGRTLGGGTGPGDGRGEVRGVEDQAVPVVLEGLDPF